MKDVTVFNNHPTVKMLVLKFNSVLPSCASVELLFQFRRHYNEASQVQDGGQNI